MSEYVICAICGYVGLDLTQHIKEHGINNKEYKEKYGSGIISRSVEEKRLADGYMETQIIKIVMLSSSLMRFMKAGILCGILLYVKRPRLLN